VSDITESLMNKLSKVRKFFNPDMNQKVSEELLLIIRKYNDDILEASVRLGEKHEADYLCHMISVLVRTVDEFEVDLNDDIIDCVQRLTDNKKSYYKNRKESANTADEKMIDISFSHASQLGIGALEMRLKDYLDEIYGGSYQPND